MARSRTPANGETTQSEDQTFTVVSYNRPLTSAAESALKPYGILKKEAPNEYGRWTVITTKEKPGDLVLEEHELRVEQDPIKVYKRDNGKKVEIYQDKVVVDGVEATLSPDEATEHAENAGWERIDE